MREMHDPHGGFMHSKIELVKSAILFLFVAGFIAISATSDHTVTSVGARANGSPNARTGAPGESNCTSCHNQSSGPGQIQITAPATYQPGQVIPITVTQTTTDTTRRAWGFQLTALDTTANAKAGTLTATTANTAVANSATKQYMNQTSAGNFNGQGNSVSWTFNWTAPATNVGNINMYVAGLQADDSGDDSGDQTYTTSVTMVPAATTASFVEISGRVTTPEGRGLRNALVVIADINGAAQTAITTSYGFYRFAEVPSGSSYVVNVRSRRYRFDAQVIQAFDDLTNVDFIGQAQTGRQ